VSFDTVDPNLPDDPDDVADTDGPSTEIEDPCLCESDACYESWIRDSGHCGECVVFACDDGDVHACAQCPGDTPGEQVPKGPKQGLEGGFGVDTPRPL
jgi:hypothetical protein